MVIPKMDKNIEEQSIKDAYEDLLEACQPVSVVDKERIALAFEVANDAHRGMRRKSGEPYILHPIAVAKIVAEEMEMDHTSVVCALLHDVVEDTEVSLEDLQHNFDPTVAKIVDGLTKIKGVFKKKSQSEALTEDKEAKGGSKNDQKHKTNWVAQQAENFRKILLGMGDDIRVILIKLADRLHNMRTLGSMPLQKQLRTSSETLFLYVPIAHRLGLYSVKSELEDLCTKFTQRKLYKDVAHKLQSTKRSREKFIREFIEPVKQKLEEGNIPDFQIFGRPKHIYSILQKIKNKKVAFEDIYDLFAIRIVIDVPKEDEKAECWRAYSCITDLYKPNPDRLRDWISSPKSNGYESLHTTVMGSQGKWVEVQIRTKRMDTIAEKGVAAHWRYKGGKSDGQFDEWLVQIRDFLKNRELNAVDFINEFKNNLYEAEIFVFTPTGDLRRLPANATILDFAFDIHTELGCSCIGAKIDNKLCSINHILKNGDQVEVLSSKKQKPTEDWLNYAITGRARTKIKSFLNTAKRKKGDAGKEILERKIRNFFKTKITVNHFLIESLAHHFNYSDSLDFLCAIANEQFDFQKLKPLKIAGDKLIEAKEQKVTARIGDDENFVAKGAQESLAMAEMEIFEGFADQVDYRIPSCCKPVAGDDVFGFITIGKGITIHRSDCPNSPQLIQDFPYRVVQIKWNRKNKDLLFQTKLRITGIDDIGIISKLTNLISGQLKINMRSIAVNAKDGIFEGDIVVFVQNTKQLKKLIKQVKTIEGIHYVQRLDD